MISSPSDLLEASFPIGVLENYKLKFELFVIHQRDRLLIVICPRMPTVHHPMNFIEKVVSYLEFQRDV